MMTPHSIPPIAERRRAALWSQRRRTLTVVVERRPSDDELFGDHDVVRLEGETRDVESGELSYRVLRVAGSDLELFAPVCGLVSVGSGSADGCQAGHLVTLTKANPDAPFWSSLAASKATSSAFAVRIDWSRWLDEDDDDKGEADEYDNDADEYDVPFSSLGGDDEEGDEYDEEEDEEEDEDEGEEEEEEEEDESDMPPLVDYEEKCGACCTAAH